MIRKIWRKPRRKTDVTIIFYWTIMPPLLRVAIRRHLNYPVQYLRPSIFHHPNEPSTTISNENSRNTILRRVSQTFALLIMQSLHTHKYLCICARKQRMAIYLLTSLVGDVTSLTYHASSAKRNYLCNYLFVCDRHAPPLVRRDCTLARLVCALSPLADVLPGPYLECD